MQTEVQEKTISIHNVHQYIVGWEREVPLLNGRHKRYINFDNAASTPTLKPVMETINAFMEWYSSIHRGTGFKSQISTHLYETSRAVVRRFLNVDEKSHTVIFGKNTTEAINKLARRLPLGEDEIIITSMMEHHSNDLPWRLRKRLVHTEVDEQGRLHLPALKDLLKKYSGKVRLVTLTGASNVTGYINPVRTIAELVHRHGGELMVDAAQWAPHRPIDMGDPKDPARIDYLAFSAHKIYAPFGLGVLAARRDIFEKGPPDHVGGGTVEIVSTDHVDWSEVPEQEEAGTPNVVGAVAMAKALRVIEEIGMDRIAEHEARLTERALREMKTIPRISIYGSLDENEVHDRLGVIPFNIDRMPHQLVAAILNFESAIGVRNGCFCAHPYIKHLLGVTADENNRLKERIRKHDRSAIPGAVRMSFGMYNTEDEVDEFIDSLKRISSGRYAGNYVLNKSTGEYRPEDYQPQFNRYFTL